MANTGVVIHTFSPFKSIFKHAHVEKKQPQAQVHQAQGLFAGLEGEIIKNNLKK